MARDEARPSGEGRPFIERSISDFDDRSDFTPHPDSGDCAACVVDRYNVAKSCVVHGEKGVLLDLREGHSLDLLESVGELDLIVTDPPYAFGGDNPEHAVSAAVATTLREAAHKLKRGHWCIVLAASSKRSVAYMEESVRGILTPVRYGTWVKPVCRTKVKTAGWAWSSVTAIAMRKGPKNAAGVPSDVLDWICAEPLMVGRRAQLPPEVAEWAVAPFVVPGGVMLDPFTGSGSLCKAAADMGMQAIGFEMNPPADGLWGPSCTPSYIASSTPEDGGS